jgi:cold shock CspA family protein
MRQVTIRLVGNDEKYLGVWHAFLGDRLVLISASPAPVSDLIARTAFDELVFETAHGQVSRADRRDDEITSEPRYTYSGRTAQKLVLRMPWRLSGASLPETASFTEVVAMQLPLQVSFRHMEHSEAIEGLVREKAARLDKFAGDIMSCRVVVEPLARHHKRGNPYEVRIDLTLRRKEIAITREAAEHGEFKHLEIALREAFDEARREIEDYVRRRRRDVKHHETPSHGRVSQVFPHQGYGFIETPDGREIYFHRHSVVPDAFDRLQVGTEVTFVEEEGRKGTQASTVRLVGRHHHV